MQLVPLRARATCNVCDSKLPPRTEAWWDDETRQATCLTCELLLRAERGEMAPPAPQPEPAPVATPDPPRAQEPAVAAPPAPAAPPRPPVLDVAPPPAPRVVPRAAPAAVHHTPQLPRLVEVTAPREPAPRAPAVAPVAPAPAPAAPPAPTATAAPAAPPAPAPTPPAPPAVEPAVAPEPPLARVRGRVPGRTRRPAPEPPRADLPARAIPPVPPLPPRDPGPVPPVDERPDPPEPAAPRVPEVPEPAAARVPEPADPPDPDPERSDPGPEGATDLAPAEAVEPAEPAGSAEPAEASSAPEDPPLADQASLHHDLDPSAAVHVVDVADGGDGGDLFAPAPIAVPVPNGDRPVDLMAPPRPAPGASAHLVPADLLDRGDMGEGRVGQTLEGGRVHGLEVVHGLRIEAHMRPIDHLVVAVNGLWVVDAVDVLAGKLERRDEGDWFTADPRLHIGGVDHTELVASVREKVEAVSRLLARTDFTDIPVRGVLCFGSVQPGWITEPFVLDGVAITWRRKLVEPMLDPVLIDQNSRSALLNLLVSSRVDPRPVAAVSVAEEREVG